MGQGMQYPNPSRNHLRSLSWPWQTYCGIAKIGGNPGPTGLRIASVNAKVVACMEDDRVKT